MLRRVGQQHLAQLAQIQRLGVAIGSRLLCHAERMCFAVNLVKNRGSGCGIENRFALRRGETHVLLGLARSNSNFVS